MDDIELDLLLTEQGRAFREASSPQLHDARERVIKQALRAARRPHSDFCLLFRKYGLLATSGSLAAAVALVLVLLRDTPRVSTPPLERSVVVEEDATYAKLVVEYPTELFVPYEEFQPVLFDTGELSYEAVNL